MKTNIGVLLITFLSVTSTTFSQTVTTVPADTENDRFRAVGNSGEVFIKELKMQLIK